MEGPHCTKKTGRYGQKTLSLSGKMQEIWKIAEIQEILPKHRCLRPEFPDSKDQEYYDICRQIYNLLL